MPHRTLPLIPPRWWHGAAVYQIYPASFKDTNGDGIGDLPGILSEVDYIASLGVDAVWLSPCYKSPMVDMGYDISDYREIDPRYGTVADVEELIKAFGRHGIKLLMDLVVNHTSDQHAWFKESRSCLQNPKRDWYIWRKGQTVVNEDGSVTQIPPNNWESLFKGSAWSYDEATDEWYLHIFAPAQPDLNWENPILRNAVYDDMRFWLDKGIGGFRMDVINMISKPHGLPDAPITRPLRELQPAMSMYCNGPRVHEFIREMRADVLDSYGDVMTVGEVPFTNDPSVVRKYVEPSRRELDMLFQFDVFDLDAGPGGKFTPSSWTLGDLKSTIAKWQVALSFSSGAWQTVFLESHDAARSVTRFGDRTRANRFKVARMLAMLEATLSGTLFMHQGQEIGVANLSPDIPVEEYVDIETKGFWNDLKSTRENGGGAVDMSDVAQEVQLKARDHGRIPMPWDPTQANAGFSNANGSVKIWTPMNNDVAECNFAHQKLDNSSVLGFWKKMLQFRKSHRPACVLGDFEPFGLDDGPVFAYKKVTGISNHNLLVVLNLTNQDNVSWEIPESLSSLTALSLSMSTHHDAFRSRITDTVITLQAYEGFVFTF